MSEDADKHEDAKDEELEALLKKLVPSPLHIDLLSELRRDQERIAWDRELRPSRIQWRRLLPLSLASALLMAGFGYLQFGKQLAGTTAPATDHAMVAATDHAMVAATPASPELTPTPATPETGTPTTGTSTGEPAPRFLPVSARGYLLNASSGGVIQTEEGPRQRLHLEYEDAYHWHDPASGTNIRFFQPRREEVIIPLQTD
ncbi:MAG: hypothetical protein GXX91_14060 [Verrucomicrobiaceae bacterium]|nr:hypothetical protein [Verrucomicrobiaceae bacterium]